MRVPISWLREYVDIEASPRDIADRLTFSGMEVEGIETVGADVPGVIVAEITAVEPHPKADRLRICTVNDGGPNPLRIVCGADNAKPGMKTAFAPVGVTLPSGMTIKRAVLRGVESLGMLCAEDELGISEDHSGIMTLPATAQPGAPLSEVLGPPETVLKLEITWNRPDCLSVIGVAREIAALYGLKLKRPSVAFPESGTPIGGQARVTVEDAAGCPRYTARLMTGIALGPSPEWMQKRLTLSGVRPISNVVDITNYVMLECGQPLHAFDFERLAGKQIVVRRARPGEKMATLDGIDRAITPEMLVIADGERPVALAGVMGGAGSEIGNDTRTVLLESASFNAASIHRTSVALGLATESSHRFERTVDVGGVDWASRRAAALMVQCAGATVAQGVVDEYPGKPAPRQLRCRVGRTCALLGIDLPATEIARILESLELPVVSRDEQACVVAVPTFRPDLELEADLIEEVARIHGLEGIPSPVPQARVNPAIDDRRTRAVERCRDTLCGLGLAEVMHYSFLSEAQLNRFSTQRQAGRAVLPNPVSADYGVMRDSLIPQMVETLGRNLSHQAETAALYELGRVFWKDAAGEIGEEDRICIGLMGKAGRSGLDTRRPVEAGETFLWLKGVVESLASALRCGAVTVQRADRPELEPGWAVVLEAGGQEIGIAGLIRADLRHAWRMTEPVGVAELRTDALLSHLHGAPSLQKLSPYPAVTRDIAMIVEEAVTHARIQDAIWKSAPPQLTRVELFDIFTGEGMRAGCKSVAYSLTFRSAERSLTDEEANGFREAVKAGLRKEINAEIREG